MELFAKLFSSLLVFVYHCFDRIVIHGYLSGLSRPEQVVYFFRDVKCTSIEWGLIATQSERLWVCCRA
jgi:hypothetical protein